MRLWFVVIGLQMVSSAYGEKLREQQNDAPPTVPIRSPREVVNSVFQFAQELARIASKSVSFHLRTSSP